MCNLSEAIMERGYGRGYEQGLEQGIIKNLLSLVKKGLLSVQDAAQEAGMTQDEFETLMEDDNVQG